MEWKIKIKSTCLYKKYSYICQTINQLKIFIMFEYPKYDMFGNEKRTIKIKNCDIVFETGRESRRRIRKQNRKKQNNGKK